jgi:hypothetical protein
VHRPKRHVLSNTDTWRGSCGHPHALRLPFLRAPLFRLPKPCAGVRGRTCADGFGLSALGFLFSRLPRCCFFATSYPFEVRGKGCRPPYLIKSPPLAVERQTKSSRTLAISIFSTGPARSPSTQRDRADNGLLGSLEPCRSWSRDELCFQLLLPIAKGLLVCLNLRHQAAGLGCHLSGHASMVIERDGSVRHDLGATVFL